MAQLFMFMKQSTMCLHFFHSVLSLYQQHQKKLNEAINKSFTRTFSLLTMQIPE